MVHYPALESSPYYDIMLTQTTHSELEADEKEIADLEQAFNKAES